MRKIVNLMFGLMLLSACLTPKQWKKVHTCEPVVLTVVRDSVSHDTISVPVPYQEIVFDTASPCPPEIEYHKSLKRGWVTATVNISKGKIHFFLSEQGHEEKKPVEIREKTKVQIVYKDRYVPVKFIPIWSKIAACLSIIFFLVILIMLYLAFRWKD